MRPKKTYILVYDLSNVPEGTFFRCPDPIDRIECPSIRQGKALVKELKRQGLTPDMWIIGGDMEFKNGNYIRVSQKI